MQQAADAEIYDVIIVGAGPAGCACALTLKSRGLRVALLDKASFPRDKVCGDAIPGRAIKTLTTIDPAFGAAFRSFPKKYDTKKTTLYYKNRALTFSWVQEAYTCARIDFDHFLFSLVQQHTDTKIFINTSPVGIVMQDDGVTVKLKDGSFLKCKILIGADGAQSPIAKQLAGRTIDRDHHVGSVRAYYKNISKLDSDTTFIYFDKRFLPSYLWVFPLPGNSANVGFGMLSSEIAKRKVNLRTSFQDFIDQTPELKKQFDDAVPTSPLEGFGLPLGSRRVTISGHRFMLVGDAASLIDPISGDGIGNAMLSGRLAAEQAIKCLSQNNYSVSFMKAYDDALFQKIGAELKNRYKAQRLLSKMPVLLDILFLASRNKMLKKLIQKRL